METLLRTVDASFEVAFCASSIPPESSLIVPFTARLGESGLANLSRSTRTGGASEPLARVFARGTASKTLEGFPKIRFTGSLGFGQVFNSCRPNRCEVLRRRASVGRWLDLLKCLQIDRSTGTQTQNPYRIPNFQEGPSHLPQLKGGVRPPAASGHRSPPGFAGR